MPEKCIFEVGDSSQSEGDGGDGEGGEEMRLEESSFITVGGKEERGGSSMKLDGGTKFTLTSGKGLKVGRKAPYTQYLL